LHEHDAAAAAGVDALSLADAASVKPSHGLTGCTRSLAAGFLRPTGNWIYKMRC